ncbi:MAG TPA: DNA-binding protein [Telluria sp.]
MSGQEISFDEVAAAAASLQNEGKRVTIETVRAMLGAGPQTVLHKHLVEWRGKQAEPAAAPMADIPESIATALGNWVQQAAEYASAPVREALALAQGDVQALLASSQQVEAERDQLLAHVAAVTSERDQAVASAAERAEEIERLNAELRNARQIAMDALVGKAKDQLAIEGKDAQLADLRSQIERNVAASAVLSDARLTAEMELIGAVTARDSLAAEVKDLRARLDAARST